MPEGVCKVKVDGRDDFAAALERFGLTMDDFLALNPWGANGRDDDDDPSTPHGHYRFPWPPPSGGAADSSTERTMRDERTTPDPDTEPETITEVEAEAILQGYDPHVAEAFRRATTAQRIHILGLFQRVREGVSDAAAELHQEATSIQTDSILAAGRRERPRPAGEARRILEAGSGRHSPEDPEDPDHSSQARRILDAGRRKR